MTEPGGHQLRTAIYAQHSPQVNQIEPGEALKARGLPVGQIPHGWQLVSDGRTLERHDAKQATLTLPRRLRADGYTLTRIAGELNRRGIRTRRNGPWYHQAICQLLTRHPTETT